MMVLGGGAVSYERVTPVHVPSSGLSDMSRVRERTVPVPLWNRKMSNGTGSWEAKYVQWF